jgi:phosphoglycerate dehydrogenase-like enzyme
MKKIFVNLRTDPDALARLRSTGAYEIDVIEDHVEKPGITLPPVRIANAEILLCDFPPANFDDMRALTFIQLASVGYTQLAGLGLAKKGIRVSNARGVFDVPIAEWNIAMMINLARDLRGMISNQENAIWDRDSRFQTEIRGRTVGLWGYGGIGRETARLAKMLGLKVHAMVRDKPQPTDENIYRVADTGDPDASLPDRFFRPDEKDAFLADLDFLILAMPMNPQNEGIIGSAELQKLPAHACVLNPARGPLIKEPALLQALSEGWIAGAALDTHYHYPMPPEHPLWKFPNVIMTPHISGSSGSPHYLTRVWDIFARNLERFGGKQALLNQLTSGQILPLDEAQS